MTSITLFDAVRNLDKRNRQLQDTIECKVKRIAELHSEIDVLNRRVEELEHELKYKDLIIQKQVIELSVQGDVQGVFKVK